MADNKDPLSAGAWRGRLQASRATKKEQLSGWRDNVAYREGKPFKSAPESDTVNVPADWSRTKNKQAQLWYQVPEVQLEARTPQNAAMTATFASALNFELSERMHVEHTMNECLGDVINAAGIMIAKVGYEATFEDVPMPLAAPDPTGQIPGQIPGQTMPPAELQPELAQGLPPVSSPDMTPAMDGAPAPAPALAPPTTLVPRPIYQCIYCERISPAHFLWPVEHTKSDWQKAYWLGWDGYKPLAEAQRLGWVDADFEGTAIDDQEWLLVQETTGVKSSDGWVKFSEVFYRPAYFDPEEKDIRKIKRLVMIDGVEGEKAKVVDEDFQWQRYDEATKSWKGLTTFPIKVATLSHISDKAIPPSDSQMGRSQVRELIRARSQMLKQRDHSMPLRWFDINQVDDEIADRLRKGKYQDMIPMNGPGDHAIGEVARAAFPHETWEFDRVIKEDLDEAWSMGAPQMSAPTKGDTTATEVRTMQSSMNVRLSFEQGWVLRFFVEIAQATASLMQLFYDQEEYVKVVGQDGVAKLEPFIGTAVPGEYLFKTKPDSQLKLDAQQERLESLNLYKLLRQDSLVNPQVLVGSVLEKHGQDPTKSMVPPAPPKKEEPKISYSFKGEDLLNPLVVALIQKSSAALTAQDIDAAKLLIAEMTKLPEAPAPGMPAAGGPPALGGPPHALPAGSEAPHGGPAPKVEELGRRYEHDNNAGAEGTRDSGLPANKG